MTTKTDAIGLNCPDCRGKLDGENNSKAFFCFNCSFCFNVNPKEGKLNRYRVLFIKPQKARNLVRIYFPFWRFESAYTTGDGGAGERGTQVRLFHIPAFFIKNINNFGDIGYYYMKKNIILEPGDREKLEVLPVVRDIQTAALYPDIYLRKEAGEITPGVPHLQTQQFQPPAITVEHRNAAMLLIPFYKEGQYYFDPILSWKYPTGAVI